MDLVGCTLTIKTECHKTTHALQHAVLLLDATCAALLSAEPPPPERYLETQAAEEEEEEEEEEDELEEEEEVEEEEPAEESFKTASNVSAAVQSVVDLAETDHDQVLSSML